MNEQRVLLDKQYSSEELSDVERDVWECLDPTFNPAIKEIPQDEHGFHQGTFRIQVIWSKS